MIKPLINICVRYLAQNLSIETSLDVMASAYLTRQQSLFNAARNYVWLNKESPKIIASWKEMSEKDPDLSNKIKNIMLNLE